MNATEYCKAKQSPNYKKHIKKFFESGYLGNATYDENKRIYDIDPSTPLPFISNSKVKYIDKLYLQLLEAARGMHSVFPSMFPRVPEQTVTDCIELLVNRGYVSKVDTASGASYLVLTLEGLTFYNELQALPEDRRIERVKNWANALAEPAGKVAGEVASRVTTALLNRPA